MESELILKDECYKIIGLCMKIHRKLGPGFREIVYKDALELELKNAGIKYGRETGFVPEYEGGLLTHGFVADFVIDNKMVLEIKATPFTNTDYLRQTLNYLRVANIRLGVLINFGAVSLQYRRVLYTK